MKSWFQAARPKTLPAAVVPVLVGSVPVLWDGDPETGSWALFRFTVFSCIWIQIATNLFNDAIDHSKGADTEKRTGPKRVSASGMLSPKLVMIGGVICCCIAALFSIPLVMERGPIILVIGLVSLFLAYGYTGGPFPLAYRGMGEIFVILFFGLVAVQGAYFVQTGELGGKEIWTLGWQCGLYSSVLIAINNLRDLDEDRETGKRTLAVRFGKNFARWEIAVFCIVPAFLWAVHLDVRDGKDLLYYLVVLTSFLFSGIICRGIFRNLPGAVLNGFLGLAAMQLVVFGLLVMWHFRTLS
ncbi:MAG: 1,4-dihydroxy-2-naphthoate octaprenyltransferase [Verrucomicrobiales bacterium]|nr:1,4-dihydroxy-2-naphthoate octaprenyltransferase [Verrucomicrobiales bacterium]